MASPEIKEIAGLMGKLVPKVQLDQLVAMDRAVQWGRLATQETTEIRDLTALRELKAVMAQMDLKANREIRAFWTKPRSKFLFYAPFAS